MKAETIVVGCDFSKLGALAVTTAFGLARNVKAKRVHLVHIVPNTVTTVPYPMSFAPTDAAAFEEMQERRAMDKLAQVNPDDLNVTREVRVGTPARDLAAAAEEVEADLIVVASHGYGAVRRAMYGSVTAALIRVSAIPVLVVTETKKDIDFTTVVAGVDLSSVAPKVVQAAVALTSPKGRTELLTAYEPPVVMSEDEDILPRVPTPADKEQFRSDREAKIRALIPNDADVRNINVDAFAKAPPANAILECADLLEADLIVIGTSGHSAWHRAFLGSTAMRVMSQARCPVLLVPQEIEE